MRANDRAADLDAIVRLGCAAIGVRVQHDAIADIIFLPAGTAMRQPTNRLAQRAADEIGRYAEEPQYTIELPLHIAGSDFQRNVWDAICRIPAGTTRSYGEIANELGNTARAVGQACGDNRLPLAIPCHRVVAADGLGGFAHRSGGMMLAVKRWLLAHESRSTFALT